MEANSQYGFDHVNSNRNWYWEQRWRDLKRCKPARKRRYQCLYRMLRSYGSSAVNDVPFALFVLAKGERFKSLSLFKV
jgi:hypothetical protein